MIEAILFDSDGVLVDTERLFFEATQEAFRSAGIMLSDKQWAVWYLSQGKSSREIAGLLGLAPPRVEATISRRNELFWHRVDQGVPLCSGVTDMLRELAPAFRLAVVTGASQSHYNRVHASSRLQDFFEVTVTSDEYEHVKPHPQAYLLAMQKLALEPEQCLAIEDSPRGATAAIAAGIRCVVIPTSLTDITLCPPECTIVDDLTRLTHYLKRG
ncbi:MAG TPA: HAD family phosphatase [Deltaproteobacteria bacterium]|nr:HAD family phosphatase [Deltaproteobacteria bacterium]